MLNFDDVQPLEGGFANMLSIIFSQDWSRSIGGGFWNP